MKVKRGVIIAAAMALALTVVLMGAVGAKVVSPLATNEQGTITNLHMSDSCEGDDIVLFPADTETVYVVFDYSGMEGEEWRIRVEDGVPLEDATRSYTGSDTECITVTHTSGPIPPGTYGTMIYAGLYPSKVKLWHVRADTPGQITNLYMSDSPDGPLMTEFPPGTQTVYAVFDYENIPEEDEIGICVREVTELETGCIVEGSKDYSGSGQQGYLRVHLPQLEEAFSAGLYRSLISKGEYVDQVTKWRVNHGVYLPLVLKNQP